ncbi:ankyrin repeat domain-containing protein [Microbacteriaceae bacterium VKM Ac-2854]|nr:ankyrin repeat domain-containing protein [Microbacteriaceae bacterium VKM Ac-2854]
MMPKRKTLPKDFAERLETTPLPELIAIFDRCLLDARGGYSKGTALAFDECPDELAAWLVAQGLDVDAADTYDRTPLMVRRRIRALLELGASVSARDYQGETALHAAAERYSADDVRLLVQHGADVHAENDRDETPLLAALRQCRNSHIGVAAETSAALIEAGSPVTDAARAEVERIGREFEFHRAGFNPDYLVETEAGLARLNALFAVAAAPPRRQHDGVSPITVTATSRPEQHQELWELLVPSSGAAATVQGEVIRISGRIADERERNGGANWDSDYDAMAAAFERFTGSPVDPRAAVEWVLAHPDPVPLPAPDYRR